MANERSLSGRLSAVETRTSTLHSDLTNLVQKVDKLADVLFTVKDQLVAEHAQVRPGLKEILTIAQSLAILFAMICAGITYIVISQVSPDITRIKKDGEAREERLSLLEADAREELRFLRRRLMAERLPRPRE